MSGKKITEIIVPMNWDNNKHYIVCHKLLERMPHNLERWKVILKLHSVIFRLRIDKKSVIVYKYMKNTSVLNGLLIFLQLTISL